MSLVLRDYQRALLDQARAELRKGTRRILIQSPTGSGKTCLVAQMLASAAARGKRAWFCVHRKELLEQSVSTFVEAADLHVGIIAAGYARHPLAPVQVCSVPSLAKRAATLQAPDLIVWDECHHVASASWATIAQSFPQATQIGLTATPLRLDGKGLGPFFDALLTGPTTQQLITAGHLAPYKFFAPGAGVNLSGVHRVAGDFNKRELSDTMQHSTVTGDAVSHYRQHCAAGRALVFVWSLEASRALAQAFTDAGIPAQHVDGETPKSERAAAMRDFRTGSLRVLCNVDLFGEGLDVPAVDAVFLLRPTQSLGLYLQQVGRGLRPAPGKSFVRIFDHVENYKRHGLPDDARTWSLASGSSKPKESEIQVKRCPQCFGVMRAGLSRCAYCGHVFVVQARDVRQVAGELHEADLDALRAFGIGEHTVVPFAPRPKTIGEWLALAKAKGYNPRWAYVRHGLTKRRA